MPVVGENRAAVQRRLGSSLWTSSASSHFRGVWLLCPLCWKCLCRGSRADSVKFIERYLAKPGDDAHACLGSFSAPECLMAPAGLLHMQRSTMEAGGSSLHCLCSFQTSCSPSDLLT